MPHSLRSRLFNGGFRGGRFGGRGGVLTGFVGKRSPTDTLGQTRPRVESHVHRAVGVGSQDPRQNGSRREQNHSGVSTSSSGGVTGVHRAWKLDMCARNS